MKMKLGAMCVITTCILIMVPVVPSVESTTVQATVQIRTADSNPLKAAMNRFDTNNRLQAMTNVIDMLKTDFHFVLPGVLVLLLFDLASWMKDVSVGPFLYLFGCYLDLFVMMFVQSLHNNGIVFLLLELPYNHW